ncbi:AAA family ATPase [Alphaproteobacteria bacterium]|nr:AAA family ATPase [Alphaproteobacteria bacterium]
MSQTSLRDRIFEVLGPIYHSLNNENLHKALEEVTKIKDFNDDPGKWIRAQNCHRLITDLIKEQQLQDHAFTKWMIENTKGSLGMRHLDLSGLYILDEAIANSLPEPLISFLTVRTIQETAKQSKPYTYGLEKIITHRAAQPEMLAERYAVHHKQFREYLETNPDVRQQLESQDIDLSFWNSPLSYDAILKQIKPPAPKAETDGSLMDFLSPQSQHKTHEPEDAPTIDEYRGTNVLQERLDRNVNAFLFRQQFDRVAAAAGANTKKGRHHLMFSGPPGTGKTTLARVLGRHFKDIGLLEKGHVVETTATALIGKYVGHTADHVRKAVEAAKGGVLFIDEIYHFVEDERFGPDAVNQLLALMENERDNFILVVAGYKEDNDNFLALNPGMRDRFGDEFMFDHFSRAELEKILQINLQKKGLSMEPEGTAAMLDYLEEDRDKNQRQYANARTLENFLEDVITQHAIALNGSLSGGNFNAVAEDQRANLLTLTKASVDFAVAELKTGRPEKPVFGFGVPRKEK